MSQIITVSLSLEDWEFVKIQQKKGLSPSAVFRDALAKIRRQVNEGIDLSEVAIAAKFDRYNQIIQKLNAFLNKKGLYYAFLEEERNERDHIEGVPESKRSDRDPKQGNQESKT